MNDPDGYCSVYDISTDELRTARFKELVKYNTRNDERGHALLERETLDREDIEDLLEEYDLGFDRSNGCRMYIETVIDRPITENFFV